MGGKKKLSGPRVSRLGAISDHRNRGGPESAAGLCSSIPGFALRISGAQGSESPASCRTVRSKSQRGGRELWVQNKTTSGLRTPGKATLDVRPFERNNRYLLSEVIHAALQFCGAGCGGTLHASSVDVHAGSGVAAILRCARIAPTHLDSLGFAGCIGCGPDETRVPLPLFHMGP